MYFRLLFSQCWYLHEATLSSVVTYRGQINALNSAGLNVGQVGSNSVLARRPVFIAFLSCDRLFHIFSSNGLKICLQTSLQVPHSLTIIVKRYRCYFRFRSCHSGGHFTRYTFILINQENSSVYAFAWLETVTICADYFCTFRVDRDIGKFCHMLLVNVTS